MIVWGRWTLRKQGCGECEELWRVCASAVEVLWALPWGPPMPWKTRLSLSRQLSSFFLFLWEGLKLPQWFWTTRWCIRWSYGTACMHTPKHVGLPWFSFHLDVIFLGSRDTLELAESRTANFEGFCQVSFERMCGEAKAAVLISVT